METHTDSSGERGHVDQDAAEPKRTSDTRGTLESKRLYKNPSSSLRNP